VSRLTSRGRLLPAAVACLVVGAVLMVFFEGPVTRVLGVAFLVAWIVLGVFTLASPEYLARADDPDDA